MFLAHPIVTAITRYEIVRELEHEREREIGKETKLCLSVRAVERGPFMAHPENLSEMSTDLSERIHLHRTQVRSVRSLQQTNFPRWTDKTAKGIGIVDDHLISAHELNPTNCIIEKKMFKTVAMAWKYLFRVCQQVPQSISLSIIVYDYISAIYYNFYHNKKSTRM